jgi:hypothetical protein
MIPIAEQLERFHASADQGYDLMVAFLQTNREVIKRASSRRQAGVGLEDYGDSTWHRDVNALGSEAIAEFADALYYLSVAVDRVGFVAALQALTSINPEEIT